MSNTSATFTTSTGFYDYWQRRKPALDHALSRALSRLLDGISFNNDSLLLASLKAGKMIRGGLTCVISEALGGTLESAIPRAVSIEMIQAATLIHDDFVDGDVTRRGSPSTWTVEGARRAVLIGDIVFAFAIKTMSDLSKDDGVSVSHAVAQVSKGALHEPLDPLALAREIESGHVDGHLYDKVIRLKTGILFAAACHLGAVAAGAERKLRDVAYRYGLRLGEAYQIADDLQEVRAHSLSSTINANQLAALTPALLRFAREMEPEVVALLRAGSSNLNGAELDSFRATQESMEKEIGHRLQSAIREVEENFPQNAYTELLRQAPRDIIKMFNES